MASIAISDIELYEILKAPLGENGAKTLVHFVESKVENGFQARLDTFATKNDIANLRLGTKNDISEVRVEMAQMKVDLIDRINKSKLETIIWIVGIGVLQFVMSVIAKNYF